MPRTSVNDHLFSSPTCSFHTIFYPIPTMLVAQSSRIAQRTH
jgi:hypothetical protein